MGGADTCAICSGPLALLFRGEGGAASAEAFSPTNHVPGAYGDLYACERCGTVQQPSLPRGDALLDLYRGMHDSRYLDEERGRRRTARRLLAALERHAGRRGRLLDVGCGHGLLLDEARAAGWEVEGLELSREAASYARSLGLAVSERPIDSLVEGRPRRRYDAIVLADVLEHLDDPLGALDACRSLLSAGGVLCVVTPDPASRMARVTGARWWGYLPAHTFLIPRATLRSLLEERGFAVVSERSLVRSFTLRYWMAGLAERGGGVGAAVSALRRVVPARAWVSLSLGDETVVVARAGVAASAGAPVSGAARRAAVAPA
jgi:SAM-dependent methyltransferase